MKDLKLIVLAALFVAALLNPANAQTWNSNAGGYNGGYGQVYQTFGLAQATLNMQQTTQMQIQKLMMQQAMEKKWGKSAVKQAQQNTGSTPQRNSAGNYAKFTPSTQTNNFKIVADTLGSTPEERSGLVALFTETKRGFESEAAKKGMKNNIAAAMTFLIATTVTVYRDAPEPTDAATENLFLALNMMFDEMPEMAAVPNKDKQFLYDTYISFSGLTLAGYMQAKESNDAVMLKQFQQVAGSLLREIVKIDPDSVRFEGETFKVETPKSAAQTQTVENTEVRNASASHSFVKRTTNFDDGWVASPTEDYVSLQKGQTEVRLFYVRNEWDKYPNTVQHEDQYWNKAVTPYFNVSNARRWSGGVTYPPIYFAQADAVDKQTGKRYFVAMKIVFNGGGRVIVAITPNQKTFEQQFPHPNDMDKMLGYNKFGVSAGDLVGTWLSGTGGGGLDFYNPAGNYIGSNSLSQDNEFIFRSGGTYQHTYRSANLNPGSNQFAKLQYNGKFSVVNDWEIAATNHYQGTTARFYSQIEAVRGGYILVLTDKRNDLKYILFQKR
jgi:hypothetical protein